MTQHKFNPESLLAASFLFKMLRSTLDGTPAQAANGVHAWGFRPRYMRVIGLLMLGNMLILCLSGAVSLPRIDIMARRNDERAPQMSKAEIAEAARPLGRASAAARELQQERKLEANAHIDSASVRTADKKAQALSIDAEGGGVEQVGSGSDIYRPPEDGASSGAPPPLLGGDHAVASNGPDIKSINKLADVSDPCCPTHRNEHTTNAVGSTPAEATAFSLDSCLPYSLLIHAALVDL